MFCFQVMNILFCERAIWRMLSLKFACFCDSYVPTHLHLMVFELVKNSLRAVQEKYMDSDKVAPPVRIIVADGIEDVTIKVQYCNSYTYRSWFFVACWFLTSMMLNETFYLV